MTAAGVTLLQAYGDALRRHAHWLIAEGYERMDKPAFAQEHEPAITGELVSEMRAFLESEDDPPWVSLYSIHDDPPLNVGGLGEDGLGCFLSGWYPATHGEAGMLGYVQSGEEADWAEDIESRLSEGGAVYGSVDPLFAPRQIHAVLHHTYTSCHLQSQGTGHIVIHHVLLRFQ